MTKLVSKQFTSNEENKVAAKQSAKKKHNETLNESVDQISVGDENKEETTCTQRRENELKKATQSLKDHNQRFISLPPASSSLLRTQIMSPMTATNHDIEHTYEPNFDEEDSYEVA